MDIARTPGAGGQWVLFFGSCYRGGGVAAGFVLVFSWHRCPSCRRSVQSRARFTIPYRSAYVGMLLPYMPTVGFVPGMLFIYIYSLIGGG